MPTFFISHGGGPWPFMPEWKASFAKTADWLSHFSKSLPEKPKAILCITAHWEEDVFSVSTSAKPPMIYDYGGFPEHTYHVQYPAPGSPEVAKRVQELLSAANIPNQADTNRGFDHGTFVPLVLMYPQADVPVVSMSIKTNYDPLDHIKMGQALEPLRDEGILILGSGLSYHNMRGFGRPASAPISQDFGGWLQQTVEAPTAEQRNQALQQWSRASSARDAHPAEDHLIPLMAVSGAAGKDLGKLEFLDHVMNVDMASYRFG